VVVDEVDEGAPPPVVRPYPWWLWLLVALFLTLAILFFVLWLLERRDDGTDVPSLTGLTQTEAADTAAARGFTLTTVRVQAAGAPGRVIDQAPQPGAELERGARMMIVVSVARRQVTVPKLAGSTADAAEQLLTSQGLQANRKTVDSVKPKGTVVAQDPAGGTKLAPGSTVTLSVSSGKGQVEVPAVQGMSQGEAVAAIVDAGLVPVMIEVPSQRSRGTVIAQDPPANQQAPAQSKVRINVSGGPASTETRTVTTSQTTTQTTQTATTRTATTRTATTVTTTTP
jgi:serine/threonine-protein kinase